MLTRINRKAFLTWALISFLICCGHLQAEFLETQHGIYQNTKLLGVKVIVAHPHTSKPGIFIYSGPDSDLQLFEYSSLVRRESESAFISFNFANNTYDAIYFGQLKYDLAGSITIKFKDFRIGIDKNTPYLTIVVEKDLGRKGSVADILGFRGIQEVVNSSGDAPVTFLEANQLNDYSELIEPYEYDGKVLRLKGKISDTSRPIGLSLKPRKNVCLDSNSAIFIESKYIKEIMALPNSRARSRKLETILIRRNRKRDLLEDSLVLSSKDDMLLSLSYLDGTVKRIWPIKTRFNDKTVCVTERLGL